MPFNLLLLFSLTFVVVLVAEGKDHPTSVLSKLRQFSDNRHNSVLDERQDVPDLGNCTTDDLDRFVRTYPSQCVAILQDLGEGTYDTNFDLFCSTTCLDDLIEFAISCSFVAEAETMKAYCGRNERDHLCVQILVDDNDFLIENAQYQCYNISNSSNETCTPGCKGAMNALVKEYGCCVENFFNTTNSLFKLYGYSDLSAYPLWRNCGLDTESMTFCLYETVYVGLSPASIFGIKAFQSAIIDNFLDTYPHKCHDVLLEIFDADYNKPTITIDYSVLCSSMCIEPLLNCSVCGNNPIGIKALCGMNNYGEYCIEVLHDHYDEIDGAETYCHDRELIADAGSCSSDCSHSLKALKRNFDCCLTNFFSDSTLATGEGYSNLTSVFLWNECGLGSPLHDCLYTSPFSLSAGAIAGIVIGVLALLGCCVASVALIGCGVMLVLKSSGSNSRSRQRYTVQANADEDDEPLM